MAFVLWLIRKVVSYASIIYVILLVTVVCTIGSTDLPPNSLDALFKVSTAVDKKKPLMPREIQIISIYKTGR